MSLAILYSRAQVGINAPLVTVETHISNGLPGFAIVGLPEAAVKESKDRVRSAIINSRFEYPSKRITVNLAPADLPKEGGRYDLAIALGILAASGQIPLQAMVSYEFLGELALSGTLRPITGVLPASIAATQAHRSLMLPNENVEEACLHKSAKIVSATHLSTICKHFHGQTTLPFATSSFDSTQASSTELDLKDVHGQQHAKRALEIAAAGRHNLLMIGPPGTGKSMLASRLPSILPPLSEAERLEVAAIASVSHLPSCEVKEIWSKRPFRNPHHTSSGVALVGGGSIPKPGEISLAHHGVLFLDELPEFGRKVLDVLREPLESGEVVISRAARQVRFPAKFQLVAAMNPSPNGYSDTENPFDVSSPEAQRYLNQVSGPLLDRIDIHIEVQKINQHHLLNDQTSYETNETSAQIRARVIAAHDRQIARANKSNTELSVTDLKTFCQLDEPSKQLLQQAMDNLGLSARATHRVIKVSRTIADLDNETNIQAVHVAEALGYRQLDRRHAPKTAQKTMSSEIA